MCFSFFGFGRKNKEEENRKNNETIVEHNYENITIDDVDNVCSQIGLLDRIKLDEESRVAIFTDIANALNSTNTTSEDEIANIVINAFAKNGVTLNTRLANMWASSYLESYIYE